MCNRGVKIYGRVHRWCEENNRYENLDDDGVMNMDGGASSIACSRIAMEAMAVNYVVKYGMGFPKFMSDMKSID